MNQETRQRLEKLQDDIHEKAEQDKVNYNNNSLYGMMLMLDSVLREDFTAQDAVNELIANSDLEIQSEVIETKVIQE
jgi:hypothetical protein